MKTALSNSSWGVNDELGVVRIALKVESSASMQFAAKEERRKRTRNILDTPQIDEAAEHVSSPRSAQGKRRGLERSVILKHVRFNSGFGGNHSPSLFRTFPNSCTRLSQATSESGCPCTSNDIGEFSGTHHCMP